MRQFLAFMEFLWHIAPMNNDISQTITQAEAYLATASQEEVVRVIREICAKRPELAEALAQQFGVPAPKEDV